ncbi:hypothetical protein BGX30_000458 [Mortierella sp. GBA39]|nr:hypothetical protein BGX30_000458 [Mortierella sp. GBA39]
MQTDSEIDSNNNSSSKESEPTVKTRRGKQDILMSLQRQTLANQGAVLATDLSIIGFMSETEVQSPPVISRHWITLECPQEHDAVAIDRLVKVAPTLPPLPPPPQVLSLQVPPLQQPPAAPTGPVDPRTFKTEDPLAAALFPETSHHPQPPPPFLPPTANAFPPRPPFHPSPHQHFPPKFGGHPPGVPHMPGLPGLPNMPPTSHTNAVIPGSPAVPQQQQHSGKFPDVKPDLGSRSQENGPQLFTILYQALEKESMVAIVALQYPDKQCVKSRRLRREKEKGQSFKRGSMAGAIAAAGAIGSPVPSLLSSDPASSPSLGITSSSITGLSAKDDTNLARATASQPAVSETDREWFGLLVVGKHYLANCLNTAPLYANATADLEQNDADRFVLLILPRNSSKPHAPWLPDFNRDAPYFQPKYTEVLSSPRTATKKQVVSEAGLPESAVASGMENFGHIRKRLKSTKHHLSILFEVPNEDNAYTIECSRRQVIDHYNAVMAVSEAFGYTSGLDAMVKILTNSLRELEKVPTVSDDILRSVRSLLGVSDVDRDYGTGAGTRTEDKPASPVKVEEVAPTSTAPAGKQKKSGARKRTIVPAVAPTPSQESPDDDDEEGPDEDLGGGSVRVRDVVKEEGAMPSKASPSSHKDESASGAQILKQTLIKPSPRPSPRQSPQPQPRQRQGSAMDLTEQDTIMEQSRPVRASRPTPAVKPEALELSIHKDIVIPEGQSESQLLSPGAPHKRRRELHDEGCEYGSSIESEGTRAPFQAPVPTTAPTHPEELAQIPAKKPIKKTKRVKAEPFDDGGSSKSPLVLSDDGEPNTGRLRPETPTSVTRSVSPAQLPQEPVAQPAALKTRGRTKQAKAVEQQQQQEQKEQLQPDLTPRALPPPTFVSQHQRTPSGTPQWLAVNSTPSLITNIKGPGRPKKLAATVAPAPATSAPQPAPVPQAQPQQFPQQPPQQAKQPQQQVQQHPEPIAQHPQPMPAQQVPPVIKEEQRHPGYSANARARSQGAAPGYYAGQAPMDHEMQHRRSAEEVVEVPNPRHVGHDSSSMRMQHPSIAHEQPGYPPRTHTPPTHERNVSATFPSGQAQHPRYDPRQEPLQQQQQPVHQRHGSTSGMPPGVADQGVEAQYRRVEDPRQRQHAEYQEHQQRYVQKQPLEHPDSMRQAPQEPSLRQRQQEWGYPVEPAPQYPPSSSANPSRAPAHYGGQGIPQEHPGHGHPTHYSTSGPPPHSSHMQHQHQQSQSQYYQGHEREHVQHPEPVAPAPSAKKTKKVKAVPKHQEEDERTQQYQASYEHKQQQLYQQQQMQQQQAPQQVQHRQEQSRLYAQQAPQHIAPQQQGIQVQYSSPGPTPPLPGRRSGQHSRNSSGSGHPGMMMMNPVSTPLPPAMDQAAAAREHSMRRNSPGPAGYEYHHPVQTHSRSRGSSPSLAGYNQSSHGPLPIQGPVVAGGGSSRQGTHSRNSSGYDMAPARGQVQDPYMTAPPGRSSGSSSHYAAPPPPQSAPQHHGQQSHAEHPSSMKQQQQAYGRHSQQDLRATYGHASSRSQDLSSLAAQQEQHSRPHEVPDVYQQHGQHPSHQQQHVQQQQYQQAVHRSSESQRTASSSRTSERQQQWHQDEQQHYAQPHPSQQQQQQGYPSHGGHQYHPSQSAVPQGHLGYPSSGGQQGMYQQQLPSDARYPSQGGPPPSSHHPDPNQGPPAPGSGSSGGSGGGGSRISLSSLLN